MGNPYAKTIGRAACKGTGGAGGAERFALQAQARGEYGHLLVPTEEPADAVLSESMELEHPVELLEPLLFLLSQMLKQATERAAQRALAIAWVEICMVVEGNALESASQDTRQRLSDDLAVYAATDAAPQQALGRPGRRRLANIAAEYARHSRARPAYSAQAYST